MAMAAYPEPCAPAGCAPSAARSRPNAAHTDLLVQRIAVDLCMIACPPRGEGLYTASQAPAPRVKPEVAPPLRRSAARTIPLPKHDRKYGFQGNGAVPLPLLICRRQAIQCSTSDLGCYQRLTSPDVSCHHIESVENVTSTVGPIRVSAHGLTLLRIDQLGGNSVLFPGARNLLNDEPTDTAADPVLEKTNAKTTPTIRRC